MARFIQDRCIIENTENTPFRKVYRFSELAEVNKLSDDGTNRMIGKKFVYLLEFTEFICAHTKARLKLTFRKGVLPFFSTNSGL